MLRSNNARGRIGLLASSSLVASTLMTGMGGLALTAFTPAVALASCTPTPAGTTAFSPTNAKGVQTCGAGDPGVYYTATGNLNLDFTGEPVSPNGVGVGNSGNWNVILGINTTTETAGNITNTSGAGVTLSGGGSGSVEIDTGSVAAGSYVGATITGEDGDGILATTGGGGTVKINAFNTVTGSVNGIEADRERCRALVEDSIGLVTALNPTLGYEASSRVAKRALSEKRKVADIVLEEGLLTRAQLDELLKLESMTAPSRNPAGKA